METQPWPQTLLKKTSQIPQDDLSQSDDDLTLAITGEFDLHPELVAAHFRTISELVNPSSIDIRSQTSSLQNLDHISVASQTKLNTET